jgi:hypothetical protein
MIFLGSETLETLEFGGEGPLLFASSIPYLSVASAWSIPDTIRDRKF